MLKRPVRAFPKLATPDVCDQTVTPDWDSHSRILALGMAPTFIEVICPSLNSIMVGMPRTP